MRRGINRESSQQGRGRESRIQSSLRQVDESRGHEAMKCVQVSEAHVCLMEMQPKEGQFINQFLL